jgi:cytochrome c oxidase subunit I
VGNNPWGAATLEWTLPSPPPHLTFLDAPDVPRGPYSYEGVSRDE